MIASRDLKSPFKPSKGVHDHGFQNAFLDVYGFRKVSNTRIRGFPSVRWISKWFYSFRGHLQRNPIISEALHKRTHGVPKGFNFKNHPRP